MPKVNTLSAFTLTLPDGQVVEVPAGESEQPPEVAQHWFTKAHLVGTPKGRTPMVEGADGLMIEADEAGQRTKPIGTLGDPNAPPIRQEGPVSWSKDNPRAKEAAQAAASEAGTSLTQPVDGRAENAKLKAGSQPEASQPSRDASSKLEAAGQDAASKLAAAAAKTSIKG